MPCPQRQFTSTSITALLGNGLLCLFLAACSATPDTAQTDSRDPYETANRQVFRFNMAVDSAAFEPVANAYRRSMPEAGKTAVENHLDWTGLPATTMNSALQGRFENAGLSVLHFAINGLTLGLAELTEDPREVKPQDFGQTLAAYDVPQGDYLMVPLFGPNTSRSLTGRVVDAVTNPLSLIKADGTATVVRSLQPPARVVVVRARQFEAINDVKYNAADPYARTRSLYFQGRAGRINARVGQPTANRTSDDLFESFFEAEK
jgi:phospholipid-binding lipoprotein MlaA